jgi:hypothetical protein
MGCIVIRGPAVRQWENFLRFQLGRLYAPRLRQWRLRVDRHVA